MSTPREHKALFKGSGSGLCFRQRWPKPAAVHFIVGPVIERQRPRSTSGLSIMREESLIEVTHRRQ